MNKKNRIKRYAATSVAVVMSAILQAFAMQTFLNPAQILSSGFTGVAVLIDKITSLYGVHFSTSLGMIALNLPVALFCFKHIGKKFVIFSMLQVFLASFFLRYASFTPLFDDELLNICFGGFVYGGGAEGKCIHGRNGLYRPLCVQQDRKGYLAVCIRI